MLHATIQASIQDARTKAEELFEDCSMVLGGSQTTLRHDAANNGRKFVASLQKSNDTAGSMLKMLDKM